MDRTVNQHGVALIEFLQEAKMCILNGRTNPDNNAFTCTTSRGVSVVDYAIVSHRSLPLCSNFHVLSCLDIMNRCSLQSLISRRCPVPDHAFMTFDFNITVLVDNIVELNDTNVNENAKKERKYKLNRMSSDFMTSELCRRSMLRLIELIESNRETQEHIDKVYKAFTVNVVEEMNTGIPYIDVNPKVRKKRRANKSFWNEELQTLWGEMHSKEKLVNKSKNKQETDARFRALTAAQKLFERNTDT